MANQIPELQPALSRSLDIASIDARMSAQIDFENKAGRFSPRNPDVGKEAKPLNRRVKKTARTALVAAGLTVATVGGVKALGEAIDHELDSGRPNFPQPSGQMFNTGHDAEGNPIRIYPPEK